MATRPFDAVRHYEKKNVLGLIFVVRSNAPRLSYRMESSRARTALMVHGVTYALNVMLAVRGNAVMPFNETEYQRKRETDDRRRNCSYVRIIMAAMT